MLNIIHIINAYHRKNNLRFTFLLLLCFVISGCHHSKNVTTMGMGKSNYATYPKQSKPYAINGVKYYPLASADGFRQSGIASWYGKDFHGKLTANGENYDMYSMTAAHKELPFNTMVRVTNKKNGKSIVVRINDRGPFVDGRIIDLTHTGAAKLEMIGTGTASVHIEAIGVDNTPYGYQAKKANKNYKNSAASYKNSNASYQSSTRSNDKYYIQIGAFGQRPNAESVVNEILLSGTKAKTSFDSNSSLWKVQAGPFNSIEQANYTASILQKDYPSSFVTSN